MLGKVNHKNTTERLPDTLEDKQHKRQMIQLSFTHFLFKCSVQYDG